jgi:hypothetical protein
VNIPARLFAAIAFLAILSGCSSIRTDNPVGISGGAQTDSRLVGRWIPLKADGKEVPPTGHSDLFLLPRKDGGYTGVIVGWDVGPTPDSDVILLNIIVGRAGIEGMLNVQFLSENGKPAEDSDKGYWPMLYRIDGDGRLHVYDTSDNGIKLVESAVQSHRLAGTSDEQSYGKDDSGKDDKVIHVHITADPKSLDAYFAENASLIFTKPMYTFERVN